MNPVLFTLYGPLAIHAYGVCIAMGVLVCVLLIKRDVVLKKIISFDHFLTGLQWMIVAGYLGGRIVFLLSESQNFSDYFMIFKFWEPGLSILGGIIGIFISLYFFVKKYHISALTFVDRLVIYAPLAQSFGRLGCFFAGCCFGLPTSSWYGVIYTHAMHMAPLHICLHPAQLYSSAILFSIFLLLYFFVQHRVKIPGMLMCTYLILMGAERFLVDFVRWDRVYLTSQKFSWFSVHQWIALAIIFGASCMMIWLMKRRR